MPPLPNPHDAALILIAPNVSEQMGGEAIKALQIFRELARLRPGVVQVTHARNRGEVERLGLSDVRFVEDDPISLVLWKSVVFRWWLDAWFSIRAVQLANAIAAERGGAAIVFQTEPNSPVAPRALSSTHANVFGPINGNIYYPAAFRSHESLSARLRRVMHLPLQRLSRLLPGGMKQADQILVAGGSRTLASLRTAGCPETILIESLDCGIPDNLLDRPRVVHSGVNLRFIHFGRLVFHKGTRLIIESLSKTRLPILLDVVGRGPELAYCKALVSRLDLEQRVTFRDWYTSQQRLFDSFAQYRGVVLPSIEDANGIVIQESMALGLPPVCLDWGGPSLLIEDGVTGYLVEPSSLDRMTSRIADRMDALAEDGALAERMSVAARASAQAWRWSEVAAGWLSALPRGR